MLIVIAYKKNSWMTTTNGREGWSTKQKRVSGKIKPTNMLVVNHSTNNCLTLNFSLVWNRRKVILNGKIVCDCKRLMNLNLIPMSEKINEVHSNVIVQNDSKISSRWPLKAIGALTSRFVDDFEICNTCRRCNLSA